MSPEELAPARAGWIKHSFISFSANPVYARMHLQPDGGLCRTSIDSRARVFDLRYRSDLSEALWEQVRTTPMGRKHRLMTSLESWYLACVTGTVLRLAYAAESDNPEAFAWQRVLLHETTAPEEKALASLFLQNLTRHWIEAVVAPARSMGFDAVICQEQESLLGQLPSTQLFVFNVSHLSSPDWLTMA